MRIKYDNLLKDYGTVPRWNRNHINIVSSQNPYGLSEIKLKARLMYATLSFLFRRLSQVCTDPRANPTSLGIILWIRKAYFLEVCLHPSIGNQKKWWSYKCLSWSALSKSSTFILSYWTETLSLLQTHWWEEL